MQKSFYSETYGILGTLFMQNCESKMDTLTQGLIDPAGYWHAVVKSASLGVWDYNLATGEKRYSSIWRDIRHLSATDPLPSNDEEWFSSVHPDDVDLARYNAELINKGWADVVSFEYRERNKNGRWVWIMCRGRALDRDTSGRATRFVGVDSDISAVRKLSRRERSMQNSSSSLSRWQG